VSDPELELTDIPKPPSLARPQIVAEVRAEAERLIASRSNARSLALCHLPGVSDDEVEAALRALLGSVSPGLIVDWADEIERLRAEVERLEGELRAAREAWEWLDQRYESLYACRTLFGDRAGFRMGPQDQSLNDRADLYDDDPRTAVLRHKRLYADRATAPAAGSEATVSYPLSVLDEGEGGEE
jgi:hypothetical protein